MSDKGPSGGDPSGLGHEARGPAVHRCDRYWWHSRSTGGSWRSRRPRHLATATTPRQAGRPWCGSSSPTDPARPCGSAWGEFYGPQALHHKGFEGISSPGHDFLSLVHKRQECRPQDPAGCPQSRPDPGDEWP